MHCTVQEKQFTSLQINQTLPACPFGDITKKKKKKKKNNNDKAVRCCCSASCREELVPWSGGGWPRVRVGCVCVCLHDCFGEANVKHKVLPEWIQKDRENKSDGWKRVSLLDTLTQTHRHTDTHRHTQTHTDTHTHTHTQTERHWRKRQEAWAHVVI